MPRPPREPRLASHWTAVGAAVGGGLLGAATLYVGLGYPAGDRRPQPEPAGVPAPPPSREDACPATPTLADAVARTRAAVVNLATRRGSLGAGVVVAPSGIVLTNAHVVADALAQGGEGSAPEPHDEHQVVATFDDGRRVPVRVLIADPREDLAILRIEAAPPPEGYAVATLGSSESLKVGEEVFAIGNPFGLGHTVSRGIVSSLHRTGVLRNAALPVLQLDAAINVGNSGGPLFNLAGELVGIVTARIADSPLGKAEGIAFALPIDHVRGFLRAVGQEDLGKTGMVGLAGSVLRRPSPALARLGYRHGIVVDAVYPGYPAHSAGVRRGDIIVALRGTRLDAIAGTARPDVLLSVLQDSVRALYPGEKLPMTLVRGDRVLEVEVEVARARPAEQAKLDAEAMFGIRLADGTDAPIVEGPAPKAFRGRRYAARLRRLSGSRIVEVMGRRVETLEDLAGVLAEIRAFAARAGGQVRVLVVLERPGGRTLRLPVRVRTP